MQLCYILEYAQAWMHGFAYLTGWLCIIVFSVCLVCRIVFGPDAIRSTPGRMFVLFGELLECMAHHFLEWYGERKIKYWHGEREKCFASKDKPGIRYAQQMAIFWREYLRSLQGIVYNLFDEIAMFVTSVAAWVSAAVQHTGRRSTMGPTPTSQMKTFVADYMSTRESILHRAREARDEAEMDGNHERMYHYENIIDTITPLWCGGWCDWSGIWMIAMSLHSMTFQVNVGARQIRIFHSFLHVWCLMSIMWFSLGASATMRCWLAPFVVSPVLLDGCYGTFLAVAWFEFTYPGFAIAGLTVFAIWSWLFGHVSRFLEGKTGWAIYPFIFMCWVSMSLFVVHLGPLLWSLDEAL